MTWLTVTAYLYHKWPLKCSIGHNYNLVLSPFMTYHRVCNMTVPHVEQELVILQEHPSSPSVFSGVRVAQSLIFCVVFCRSLFVFFFLATELSVLLWITASDYIRNNYMNAIYVHCWKFFNLFARALGSKLI